MKEVDALRIIVPFFVELTGLHGFQKRFYILVNDRDGVSNYFWRKCCLSIALRFYLYWIRLNKCMLLIFIIKCIDTYFQCFGSSLVSLHYMWRKKIRTWTISSLDVHSVFLIIRLLLLFYGRYDKCIFLIIENLPAISCNAKILQLAMGFKRAWSRFW